ncbi:hypothetical protein CEXT_578921 [Caerostris extrusa]|uniref:Uncharacterized protein n=1 Tax=Caerostris extrusa TaxID=172846 RepID=A0AAV4NA35_CAEEX|nr:hypothetical protein CEXT_578921 [Caerostris extrusa]
MNNLPFNKEDKRNEKQLHDKKAMLHCTTSKTQPFTYRGVKNTANSVQPYPCYTAPKLQQLQKEKLEGAQHWLFLRPGTI